ncbi:UDP-glycosyltransferase 83A1 [Camellia lanceoleosa]|uniref:UDP-glycosyltransferase 83A1 n=1 Tax=Camellia lanceoleosa TaxID=1840588 RepID=A0ACC0J427_9ERIC|nr:UDP-glycosyltransferase 83A1 [Camellia lanceoleosa]
MGRQHVLAIPYPAQGHVLPLLELMQCLAKHGFKVTFVNTEFTHESITNALSGKDNIEDHIHLVSIPDGLEPWEDRNEFGKLTESIFHVMPGKLEELIEHINGSDNDKIPCIVADELLGWALEVAEKMQIKRAAFWSMATALLALGFRIPELLDDGIINNNANSVIHVAFGSFTVFDQIQFQELALVLELTNRPFLWVVLPDITDENNDAYPKGFKERAVTRGRVVGWAPQQKVLGHPSVACFLSHCGWNSTMEGLSNGIPLPCWPKQWNPFADQFFNQSYICDLSKVGLGFNCDENGIVKQGEIKDKVEQLFSDKTFKARSLDLKEVVSKSAKEGGCSHSNFNNFIEWMKA